MITTVSSVTALNAALQTAKGGDTILLAPGSYAGISIRGVNFADGVTIASKNPDAPALILGLAVRDSSGVTFEGLEFVSDPAVAQAATVQGSSDIAFNNVLFHGSIDGNPQNDSGGLLVRSSSDVRIADSEFHELYWGVGHLDVVGLTITGSSFHDLRMDGIRGGGSSDVLISRNTFTDFKPVTGDHPDAIQFWTSNTTAPARDIVISENVIIRGEGGIMQGIFLRDEAGGLPYEGVQILNNLVSGAMYNGLAVTGARHVVVEGNTVQGFLDMKSFIRLEKVDGATITDNASNVVILSGVTNVVQTGTTLLPLASDGGAKVLALWRDLVGGENPADTPMVNPAPTGVRLEGSSGLDTLTGGAGSDTLSGGSGGDVLAGGAGNDLYTISGKATLVETAQGGVDTVKASAWFSLPDDVENIELTGVKAIGAQGNGLNNVMTGNSAANSLVGRAGADTISAAGGADTLNGGVGADDLIGGAGADRFVFSRGDGADVIRDFGAGGEHDVIDASALLSSGVQATLTQTNAGVAIAFTSGDSILVQGLQIADLHATSTGWIF